MAEPLRFQWHDSPWPQGNPVDVIIVGGGMVGTSLAAGLRPAGLRIALVEPNAPERYWPAGETDIRVSALTRASQCWLEHLGAWPRMQALGVAPYQHMQVWTADERGQLHFHADELGEPDLGHIVENRVIRLALWEQLETQPNLRIFKAPWEQARVTDEAAWLRLTDGTELGAPLLVIADGRDSALRQRLGYPLLRLDYDQAAVVANFTVAGPVPDTAWQVFLPNGPLAFLPLHQCQYSIVWSTTRQQAQQLLELDPEDFTAAVMTAAGSRLGPLQLASGRAVFPLRLQHTTDYWHGASVVIGDAAHAVHPLAGQGVNMGFLDAAELAQILLKAGRQRRALGSRSVLRAYERRRRPENLAMLAAMDAIKRLFAPMPNPLEQLRGLGMMQLDRLSWLKNHLVRHALGLHGPIPGRWSESRPGQ